MAGVILNGATSGATTLNPVDAVTATITLPSATSTLLGSTAVSASTLTAVTNKIAVQVNGTTYYLLASTSGV